MSYVEENLMTGETIEHNAKITWVIYLPSFFMFLLAWFLLFTSEDSLENYGFFAVSGVITTFIGILSFISSFITRWTTELVVTSKRVIYKAGFISRKTRELNHLKVESFHLDQGIIGRIFDFGTIIINGTGGGKTPIRNIDSPLDFRKRAMEIIDPSQEFKKEVSTEVKNFPHCEVDKPIVIDHNNRRLGFIVFALIIFLCVYIFTKHEPEALPINQEQPTLSGA